LGLLSEFSFYFAIAPARGFSRPVIVNMYKCFEPVAQATSGAMSGTGERGPALSWFSLDGRAS